MDWDSDDTQRPPNVVVLRPEGVSPITPTPFTWVDPRSIPRRQWLYGRHLMRRYVSMTVAPGGLGKSSLLMAEAVAMVSGRPLLGDRPSDKLRVWYWNGEDDQEENYRRIAAICLHHKVTPDQIGDRLFLDTGREKDILLASDGGNGFTLNNGFLNELERTVVENRIDVLILDPFVATHGVGENDNMAINAVIRALARIAERANCAIELVHHIRKPAGGSTAETDVNDARGASALIGGVRSARVLNGMTREEAEAFDIQNRFQYFHVDNGKSNFAPRADTAVWRRIEDIDLGNGGDHLPDQVGVVDFWEVPKRKDGLPTDVALQVQSLVARGRFRTSPSSPDWLGKHLLSITNLSADAPDERKFIVQLLKDWKSAGALAVESGMDEKRRPRDFYVVGTVSMKPQTFT